MNAMRNALILSLTLLSALMFSTASQAEDNFPDQDLHLKLDSRLDPQWPLLPERKSAQGLSTATEMQLTEGYSLDSDYQLGQGWRKGNYYLSGYVNIEVLAPRNDPAELVMDDLSLFIGGHVNRWFNPFIEAEISSYTVVQQGGGARGNGYIVSERLYNDSLLFERNTLRAGKMLSPVGHWNLIHAAPLVPTNTRPLTTYRGFSEYATGASWIYDPENGETPDWQLYWQPGSEIPRRPKAVEPRTFSNVLGGHINIPFGLLDRVGVSLQHGHLRETEESFTLYGANFNKSFGKLKVESEAIASIWSGSAPRAHDQELGIFGLLDYTFAPRWHGILEWERYQDHEVVLPSKNILLGVSYKFSPAVLKLEYVHQMGESPFISSGWQASFSSLF